MLNQWLRVLFNPFTFHIVPDGDGDGGGEGGAEPGAFDAGSEGGGAFDDDGGTGDNSSDGGQGGEGEGSDGDKGTGGEGGQASDKDGDGGSGSEKDGAPETYADFKIPEGYEVNEAFMADFVAEAKEDNLTQEQAQERLGRYATWLDRIDKQKAEEAQAHWDEQANGWAEMSRAQGVMTKENMGLAARGLSLLDTTDRSLNNTLIQLGLHRHPGIIRAFAAYGREHGGSNVHDGGSSGGQTTTAESVMYDNS